MIGEIIPIELNIEMTMMSIPLLISRMFLLTVLKVNISELGSQDAPKTCSIGFSSMSKFTIFGDKFLGDIYFMMSRLLEITFALTTFLLNCYWLSNAVF